MSIRRVSARMLGASVAALAGLSLVGIGLTSAAAATNTYTGHLDSVVVDQGGGDITGTGWAANTATPHSSIPVRLTVGSYVADTTANQPRKDVGNAYPALGPNHGFTIHLASIVPAGTYHACGYALSAGGVPVASLGCFSVTVPKDVTPIGQLEPQGPYAGPGRMIVHGWAIDMNTPTTPIHVTLFFGGMPYQGAYKAVDVLADQSRPDVGRAYPSAGPNHGFNVNVPVRRGSQPVCAYALNSNPYASNTFLGCRTMVGG